MHGARDVVRVLANVEDLVDPPGGSFGRLTKEKTCS